MKLLHVQHLSRRFDRFLAVDDVSFEVHPGELLALIGPNGAGKTTTFNMVGGQLPASSGSVQFLGTELLGLGAARIARLGVARTFQIAATFPSFTVLQNVQTALLAHQRKIFSFLRPAASRYRDEALDLLAQVGMQSQADRLGSELAYGDVKRVELAMALASSPRLLLMDEPTAGMAPAERNALMALTRRLVDARQMGVLYTEHSMDVVFRHSDRILVLAGGQLIAEGDAAHIRNHPRVQAVYFGSGRLLEEAP